MFKVSTKMEFNNLPEIRAGMRAKADRAVRETCMDIMGRARASMTGPKHGWEYGRRGGKMHQASAPGESPAIDTGLLVNSIQTKMMAPLTGIVFTNTEYAPVLEFGGVKMAARPFFSPAGEAARPVFLEKMKKLVY